MRALIDVTPTKEQLTLFARILPGIEVIRGAAGSGKTTTALLKLRSIVASYLARKRRKNRAEALQVLVLTYNRTLSGYVRELANHQVNSDEEINLEISTFAKWARGISPSKLIIAKERRKSWMESLANKTVLPTSFAVEEADYAMGRFLPSDIDKYLTARRDGRGGSPRMERATREQLLEEVIKPYIKLKASSGLIDWNDLAVDLATTNYCKYEIVIVDETQDFSANQIRAVMNQVAEQHTVTFVLDNAQRIYASGFTWQEVGLTVRPENSFRLKVNFRNTRETAEFAAALLAGLAPDDDATIPDFTSAKRSGDKPVILKGNYPNQVEYAIKYIEEHIDKSASIAFLHPKGWFKDLRCALDESGLSYVELTRNDEWPQGDENIALSTLHSAKGLEFDYIFILGLDAETLPHGSEFDDEQRQTLQRLVAMGVGRAKERVFIGYKPERISLLLVGLNPDLYEEVLLG